MNNQILGEVELKNASISFKGDHNIFFCKKKGILENCQIRFTGSNSLVFIDENDYPLSLNMRLGNDSVIYIEKKCYTNKTSFLYATERKHIFLGDELLLSFHTYFRTADPHILYDAKTNQRINPSQSIFLGDHIWIGQECFLLKGTIMGSGSVLGGHSVITKKIVPSNTLYAGNPAKKRKEHIFYGSPEATHDFHQEDIEKTKVYKEKDSYVYKEDEHTLSFQQMDETLSSLKTSKEKKEYLETKISNHLYKNRFAIDEKNPISIGKPLNVMEKHN